MGGQQEVSDVQYDCTLSSQAKTKAKLELREDEAIRKHSLEKFREWIEKHPNIRKCRTDAIFLLRFLRTTKFSLPLAQNMLERYLITRQSYPEWFRDLDINDPEIEAIVDAGYSVPLLKRDNHGRKVILTCIGRFDPYKYTSTHMVRVHSLAVEALMDEEENQVHGYTHLYDESGLTMSHVSAWSFNDIRKMINCIQSSTPMRLKESHLVNVPGCASTILATVLGLLSEKLRNRVKLHKNFKELHENIDPKILPKEYGGDVPLSEMIEDFKKVLKAKRDQIRALDDMEIEVVIKEEPVELAGSFRKLEVD